jgi:hypothetical protein
MLMLQQTKVLSRRYCAHFASASRQLLAMIYQCNIRSRQGPGQAPYPLDYCEETTRNETEIDSIRRT